ncbi:MULTISPECIES: hypothetical protein [unclassified Bradyrhizobium]|nr:MULTISPECIES: hypothetical protein [unclassified Bradyrhizobium]
MASAEWGAPYLPFDPEGVVTAWSNASMDVKKNGAVDMEEAAETGA